MRPIPDLGVLNEANAFRRASQLLNACPESVMSVPAVVNAAFALELYLKSLNIEWQVADPATLGDRKSWLESRKSLQTGHAPSKLFGALDQKIRSEFEQKYQEQHQGLSRTTLEQSIASYDGIFQDWRYIFEGRAKSVDLSELFAILTFFSETLEHMPQQWA